MDLQQISSQKGENILDFYSEERWPAAWGKMPEMMTQLIILLGSIESEPVWVFTSHEELLFTDKDDSRDWLVLAKVIELDGQQLYKITAAQKEPWHHLTGFAENADFAAQLIMAALGGSLEARGRNIFFDSN